MTTTITVTLSACQLCQVNDNRWHNLHVSYAKWSRYCFASVCLSHAKTTGQKLTQLDSNYVLWWTPVSDHISVTLHLDFWPLNGKMNGSNFPRTQLYFCDLSHTQQQCGTPSTVNRYYARIQLDSDTSDLACMYIVQTFFSFFVLPATSSWRLEYFSSMSRRSCCTENTSRSQTWYEPNTTTCIVFSKPHFRRKELTYQCFVIQVSYGVWTVDWCACARKLHLWTNHMDLIVTLTFDLLISKRNRFISVCTAPLL